MSFCRATKLKQRQGSGLALLLQYFSLMLQMKEKHVKTAAYIGDSGFIARLCAKMAIWDSNTDSVTPPVDSSYSCRRNLLLQEHISCLIRSWPPSGRKNIRSWPGIWCKSERPTIFFKTIRSNKVVYFILKWSEGYKRMISKCQVFSAMSLVSWGHESHSWHRFCKIPSLCFLVNLYFPNGNINFSNVCLHLPNKGVPLQTGEGAG